MFSASGARVLDNCVDFYASAKGILFSGCPYRMRPSVRDQTKSLWKR